MRNFTNFVIITVISVFLLNACANNKPEYKRSMSYDGQSPKNFLRFSVALNKSWVEPEKLGYFDPSGAEGKVLRYGFWKASTDDPKGTIVHFNGRTEFIERNIYAYGELVRRGYDVWTMDWRGQGLSARFDPTVYKQKHHIDDFQTYVNDAEYFIENIVEWESKTGQKILMAHSMGGQIALRYLIDNSNQFDAVVLSSPLLRLPRMNYAIDWLNAIKVKLGFGESCVYGEKEYWKDEYESKDTCVVAKGEDGTKVDLVDSSETYKYSNDLEKLADISCMIRSTINETPSTLDLRLACPTSSWVRAALDSTKLVFEKANMISVPIMIIRDETDEAVDPKGQDEFCRNQKTKCEIVDIEKETERTLSEDGEGKGVGHELLIEEKEVIDVFFRHFDKFVDNPSDYQH